MPVSTTRDRLLDIAFDLFTRNGFHAIGLDRVISEAKVTKTTFYNHFSSKDELVLATVEKRGEFEWAGLERALREREHLPPREKLLAIFDVEHAWFNEPQFHGCIFQNLAAAFPHPADPAHRVAASYKLRYQKRLRDIAQSGGYPDPSAIAEQLMVLIEGAIMLRYVTDNREAALRAKEVAALVLDATAKVAAAPPAR